MPRYNQSSRGFIDGGCKSRKRGCSSSSSSSLPQSNRLKRAIRIRKNGASTSSAPMWRMNVRSPSSLGRVSDSSCCPMSGNACSGTHAHVSARKLANALWEMSRNSSSLEFEKLQRKIAKWEKSRDNNLRRPIEVISQPQRPFNEGHSPVLLRSEKTWCTSHRKQISRKSGLEWLGDTDLDCFSCGNVMESEFHFQNFMPGKSIMSAKGHLKDLRNALSTSKELLKILSRFWEPAEQHNLASTVFSAVRTELEQAILNVDQLFQEQRSICSEINCLKEKLLFEIQMFKNKEREWFSFSFQSIMKELQSEKKLRRRAKRLNKNLAMELAVTRASLLQANNELASERRSREILEHVCDELAKGIGGERAEVDKMKMELAKVLELGKERELLQLADEWRENRVQMKLSEAKQQFEERNSAGNQLRNELEAFLTNGMGSGVRKRHDAPARDLKHEEENTVCPRKVDETVEDEEKDSTGELSEDCDLHSIELNMDCKSRSFNWSYATGSAVFGRSFEESNEGGSENSNKELKSNEDVNEENSRNNSQVFSHDWPQGRHCKSNASIDEDADIYISVKELRDHLLAGSRINLPPGMRSPCQQRSRSKNQQQERLKGFHDSEERLCEGLKVADLVKKLERVDRN